MIITIARQAGCGALEVGQKLAARYGLPLYTRQDLATLAHQRGLAERMDDFFDERPVDELLFSVTSYGEERSRIARRPLQALARMLADEDCIIIGRCGNFIFRQRPDLISVFLSGKQEARIRAYAAVEGCSLDEARERVCQTDENRAVYHHFYTGLVWGRAADYDLCLDTMRLGAEGTAEIIAEYARINLTSSSGLTPLPPLPLELCSLSKPKAEKEGERGSGRS